MSGMFPNYILREWYDDGRLLAGGKIYLYQSGTLVPKAAYTDATYTVPLSNPVILDAGGAADIFLGNGAYRAIVKDVNDVQIRPAIDGITGTGAGAAGPESNITFTIVKLYADLRSLATIPDLVYVSGRAVEGDGGQGWFQYCPGSGLSDDDGAVLTSGSGSNVYQRVFEAVLDLRWYGVKYNVSINNKIYWDKAMVGSAMLNYPVQLVGSMYITQSITIPTGASVQATEDGYFIAPAPVNVTFADGSYLQTQGRTFGTNVTPVIGNDVCPNVCLSWMGGTDDERAIKLFSATTKGELVLDDDIVLSTNITAPANTYMTPSRGVLTISTAITLNLPVVTDCRRAWLNITTTAAAANINVGSTTGARLAWFTGAGATIAAFNSKFIRISQGEVLTVATAITLPTLILMNDGCNHTTDGLVVANGGSLTISSQMYASDIMMTVATGGTFTAANWRFQNIYLTGTGPWGVASATLPGFYGSTPGFGSLTMVIGGNTRFVDLSATAPVKIPLEIDFSTTGGAPTVIDRLCDSFNTVQCGAGLFRTVNLGPPNDAAATTTRRVVLLEALGTPGSPSNFTVNVGSGTGAAYSQMDDQTAYTIDVILQVAPGKASNISFSGYQGAHSGGQVNNSYGSQTASRWFRCVIAKNSVSNNTDLLGFWS